MIPELEKTVTYFENGEESFPKHVSLKKAKALKEFIAEIKTFSEMPELIKLNL